MIVAFVTLLALASPAAVRPSAAPSAVATVAPAPRPSGLEAIAARAAAFYGAMASGTIDRTELTPAFAAELTDATVRAFGSAIAPLGKPGAFALRARHDVDGVMSYDYTVPVAGGSIAVTFGVDEKSDRIARFYVRRGNGDVR